jgi:hypothetical protein
MADNVHDYSKEEVGRRHRGFAGVVQVCPKCGTNGLRRVYSWARGRYRVVYVHEAVRELDGTRTVLGCCSVTAEALGELPASERRLGRG